MTHILLSSPFRQEFRDRIIAAGGDACQFDEITVNTPPAEQAEMLARAEVVIGFLAPPQFAAAKNLRWLQATWAGVDALLGQLPESVLVTNASGAFGPVISEHMLAAALAICRRFPGYARLDHWQALGSEKSLEGARVLILGAGDIGSCTARRLRAFGSHVVGLRRTLRAKPDCFDEMYTMEALDEQLALADFVLCCLPGTPETRKLLDARRLALLKQDAVIVNVGRGSLIDLEALTTMLQEGRLFGASLDVTDPEPLPADSPLWTMDNVLITPHIAGIGFGHLPETEARIADICAENLRRYLRGETLQHIVDKQLGY